MPGDLHNHSTCSDGSVPIHRLPLMAARAGLDTMAISDHDTLLKRFSATRRRHPLSDQDMSLSEAIAHEGELLASIQTSADLLVDTSKMDPHTLRNLIRDRVAQRSGLEVFAEDNTDLTDAA